MYFILAIYSLAIHLRRGTYHKLPLSRPAPNPSGSHQHTRHSSTGGPQYHHLRNTSIATSAGGDFGDIGAPSPSLGETLWEQDEFLGQSQRLQSTGEVPPSPAYAKGTGMARSQSLQAPGMLQRNESSQGDLGKTEQDAPSPFAKVLGKISSDFTR